MMLSIYNLKTRIQAAWKVLVSKHYVVLYAKVDKSRRYSVYAKYSVTHKSFWMMFDAVDEAYQKQEAEANIEFQLKEILK